MRHVRTDPACKRFRGYGRTWLGRLLFDRHRGYGCWCLTQESTGSQP